MFPVYNHWNVKVDKWTFDWYLLKQMKTWKLENFSNAKLNNDVFKIRNFLADCKIHFALVHTWWKDRTKDRWSFPFLCLSSFREVLFFLFINQLEISMNEFPTTAIYNTWGKYKFMSRWSLHEIWMNMWAEFEESLNLPKIILENSTKKISGKLSTLEKSMEFLWVFDEE